jgi:tetratricopeptide (TPR) repeat protein
MTDAGADIRVVWIAGATRCGSMWTYNVTRELVRAAGFEVLPARVPQRDEAMWCLGEEGIRDPSTGRMRVLKIHSFLPPDLPHARFIVPRREVREILLSSMRFTRSSFEQSLRFVDQAIAADHYYRTFPGDRIQWLEYEDIVARPDKVARTIVDFLGLAVENEMRSAIVHNYSRDNVRALIKRREQDVERRIQAGGVVAPDELVQLGRDNVRVFDTATGFQIGHVSEHPEDTASDLLTPEQAARLDVHIGAVAAACNDAVHTMRSEAYNNRGFALRRVEQPEEALDSFDKALTIEPHFAEAHINRGIALKDLGRFDEAVASYDTAIALQPELAAAYINRGNALRDLKRFNEAIASYEKGAALDPRYTRRANRAKAAISQLTDRSLP